MDRPPAVDGHLLGRGGELAAGVVDENVETTKACLGRIQESGHLLGLAHITGVGERGGAQRLDTSDRLLERLDAPTAHDEVVAVAREGEGGGSTDAGAGPGHEGDGTGHVA